MIDAQKIAEFIRQNYAGINHWSDQALIPWLEWYQQNRLICLVTAGDRIKAVGMARALTDVSEHAKHYAHTEGAPIIWIELAVAEDAPGNLSILWEATCERFPYGKTAAFSRTKDFATTIKRLPFERLAKHMRGSF